MRICDWSSDVCSSDLAYGLCLKKSAPGEPITAALIVKDGTVRVGTLTLAESAAPGFAIAWEHKIATQSEGCVFAGDTLYVGEEVGCIWELNPSGGAATARLRSEEHTSELKSPMRNSYADI